MIARKLMGPWVAAIIWSDGLNSTGLSGRLAGGWLVFQGPPSYVCSLTCWCDWAT